MFKKLKETLTGHKEEKSEEVVEKVTKSDKVSGDVSPKAKAPKKSATTGDAPRAKGDMELTDEQKQSVMGKLSETMKNPPIIGDLVEGPVIAVEKSSVYVDLAPFGTGIIYGREFIIARDVIKKINVGDVIAAKIVDTAHKEGYYELSLKEARPSYPRKG
jgi:exosome complex RNA-binding protein Csl4